MSLRLILIRHAKSSWDDPFADDHERMLNDRGRRSATAIGRWLKAHGYLPQLILSSDSVRTRETADRVVAEWTARPEIRIRPELYHAAPQTLLATLRHASGSPIALIAHNPGIGIFANALVTAPADHARFRDYPTGATAVIDFDIHAWHELQTGTGRIIAFIIPRELMD